jgi:hypothetical protein
MGGNVQHTGEAMDAGYPPLTLAWTWEPARVVARSPQGVVSAAGRLAVVTTSTDNRKSTLHVLETATGRALWASAEIIGGIVAVVDGPRLYAVMGLGSQAHLDAFDAATGALDWSVPYTSQASFAYPGIVVGGRLFTEGGFFGGLAAFDGATGAQLFLAPREQFDQWSPAWDGSSVLAWVNETLTAFSPTTGVADWSLAVRPPGTINGEMLTSPVVADGQAFIVDSITSVPQRALSAVDLSTHTVRWSVPIESNPPKREPASPAFSEGAVYIALNGVLEARNAQTGSLLWTFTGDGLLYGAPVIAGGFVYVSSNDNVYAVSKATHAAEWTSTPGGALALTDGLLVVATGMSRVAGWALTH